MFKSHLFSLIVFSGIVSVLMAFIKFENNRVIWRYALKHFIYMIGGVVVFSWIMRFI
ncbi:hypothetical protein ACFLT9_06210 [Acidobacteriota bacterium]